MKEILRVACEEIPQLDPRERHLAFMTANDAAWADEASLVGVSLHDLQTAHAADLRKALATYGCSLTPLRDCRPDVVIDRLENALDLPD